MPLSLLIATTNRGKQAEFRQLLRGLHVRLLFPQDLGLSLQVEESGQTYAENAALKARAWAQASGLLTLADDSGLEVEALDGAPGIYSARYAPQPQATDADRRRHLLRNLARHPRPWKARFRCVLAIAEPQGPVHFAEGVCPGEIIPEERGEHGFGYDPIFLLPEQGKTMAELTPAEKNRLSHRGRAVQAAWPLLMALLAPRQGT
ncbi:MAG TPA: RdgB/HAM1 family non-canonical purine NTP pyrophosphatase [Anaerolineae bacterium]|nr:RdgB/HAM1 family non-canonical purine NTP pyrophosphatase [Anaerolineae bacterium]HID83512.1 RdgB/HAM1 family non-canonical purine NTP pyrophosphatase [Anaerolineales bacterium]HIQ09270.1 RdgB/HAM1 family non-canonical purine NTP pyrophosphatase [Anaerolineaceae bacterium]